MKRAGWAKGESKGADEIFSASCQKLLQAKRWSGGEKTRESRLGGERLSEETLCR